MARYTHFKVWLDGKIVDPEAAMLSVFRVGARTEPRQRSAFR